MSDHIKLSDHCLIVIGMHRSGTSCLTGTIEQCGVCLGEVFTQNPFNKKGNRESARVQRLNDLVLAANEGAWNVPVEVTSWSDELCRERDRIITSIKADADDWWGFKDPRVVLTLPFWLEALENPAFIGTYRHPHRVALSLNHRDQTPIEDSYSLWLAYNRKLLELQKQFGFSTVDFDLPDAEYEKDVTEKLLRLGLKNQSGEFFFDPKLRNQAGKDISDVRLPPEVADVYEELKEHHVAF